MKKLLLIALVIGGFAFAAQRSDGQSTTGSVLGFQVVTPLPSYLNYYPYGYYRRPYVHYYPFARNAYSYYSAPPMYRTHHRQQRHHHRHSH